MRAVWILCGVLVAASMSCGAQPASTEDPSRLVHEVVYNELHDHDNHGYFRYWVEQRHPDGTHLLDQIETADGPVTRTLLSNGQKLDEKGEEREETRLRQLKDSASQRASLRQSYQQDEERVGRILAMLADAFVYTDAGQEKECRHLRFTPNPRYVAHTIEGRVFQRLSGDLWIDTRMKRMKRLEGHLDDDVTFGLGMLGRVNRGSWFRMARTQVSADEWKTERLELHMSGRALLFKTIARDTTELRGGFLAVPPKMTFERGLRMLDEPGTDHETAMRIEHSSHPGS